MTDSFTGKKTKSHVREFKELIKVTQHRRKEMKVAPRSKGFQS